MSATSNRKVTVVYSGDVGGTQELAAAENQSSPAMIEQLVCENGINTVIVPEGATCCTITKPSDNTVALTFKGADEDTGMQMHDTDPDSFSIHANTESFVIYADLGEDGACTLRLFWS